jgi:hypothetical protein
MELVKQLSKELRERGNKAIKIIFWNDTQGNLSVVYKDGRIINYPDEGVLDPELSISQICDNIESL